jgi:hypothetical protein
MMTGKDNIRILDRIVADLHLHFEKVAKVVTEYRTAGPMDTTKSDPISTYVHEMLARAETGVRSGDNPPTPRRREAKNLRLLDVNHFIEDVVEVLQKIVKRRARLQVVPADRELRVVADRAKMSRVFASIVAYGSEIIQKGGTITILAKLLPMESDLTAKGGCALLSVSSADVAARRPGPGHRIISRANARRAFSVIRSIIREHHGAIQVLRQPGKAQFNIYLPVVPGT